MTRRQREVMAGRLAIQWHRVVDVTLTEGEGLLPRIRLEGLRGEFEYADHLLGLDQLYVRWAREERAAHGPEVERALARYERILKGTYPPGQLDGAPIGETMSEHEALRALYAAIAEEGRRERGRVK